MSAVILYNKSKNDSLTFFRWFETPLKIWLCILIIEMEKNCDQINWNNVHIKLLLLFYIKFTE